MDNLDLFKDFLGGGSFSADYMRDTLGVMQEDDAGGMYYDEELDALELADDDIYDDEMDNDIDDDEMDSDTDDDEMDNGIDDDEMDSDTDNDEMDNDIDDDEMDSDTGDDEMDDDIDDDERNNATNNDNIDANIDDDNIDDDGICDDEILDGENFDDEDGHAADDDDVLLVSEEAINDLLARASDVERPEGGFASHTISFAGVKICATRHGCKGATNCDYSYGAPVRQ